MAPSVGFLGLGTMGSLMAANISRHGFQLILYNRTRSKANQLARELGAEIGTSPARLAEQCSVILTMVSDATVLHELYFGQNGIIQGLRAETTCIDMSTVGPSAILHLEERLRSTGARLLDAPVSGSVALARDARLTMMVGGRSSDVEGVREILRTMASRLFHVGPLGAGAALKLAVNSIVYGLNQALAEGLVLAEAAGIDREVAYALFENSAIAAPYVQYRREAFLKPGHMPIGLSLDLAHKDLDLIASLADDLHAPMPQMAVNLRTIESARGEGRGTADVSAIAEHLRQQARSS